MTYDATLAELTSLEEMMRYMMDDDQIHPDVVNKLWQVYSEYDNRPFLLSSADSPFPTRF